MYSVSGGLMSVTGNCKVWYFIILLIWNISVVLIVFKFPVDYLHFDEHHRQFLGVDYCQILQVLFWINYSTQILATKHIDFIFKGLFIFSLLTFCNSHPQLEAQSPLCSLFSVGRLPRPAIWAHWLMRQVRVIAGGRCGCWLVIAGGTRWALGPWLRQSLANWLWEPRGASAMREKVGSLFFLSLFFP